MPSGWRRGSAVNVPATRGRFPGPHSHESGRHPATRPPPGCAPASARGSRQTPAQTHRAQPRRGIHHVRKIAPFDADGFCNSLTASAAKLAPVRHRAPTKSTKIPPSFGSSRLRNSRCSGVITSAIRFSSSCSSPNGRPEQIRRRLRRLFHPLSRSSRSNQPLIP